MNCPLPTEEEETEDPIGADQQYDATVNFLREATRDRSKFPLVFAENVNYGFRRNLWGLKPFGLSIALLAAIGSWGFLVSSAGLPPGESWLDGVTNADGATITRLVSSMLNTLATAVWILVIRPEWVRTVGEAYAERLLNAVNTLDPNIG